MKLECKCGNTFNLSVDKFPMPKDRTCPLCGRIAEKHVKGKSYLRMLGGSQVEAYRGGYSYRTFDGMGGKIPKRSSIS